MKNAFLLLTMVLLSITMYGQSEEKWPAIDASVMDMAYYPSNVAFRNYLTEAERNIKPQVKIAYSRPKKNNREIFGNLVPYGAEWRLGANEATTITFYQAVEIGAYTIQGGTYTVFADVEKDQWTLHLSTEMGLWGGANRDMTKNVASIVVPTETTKDVREELSMTFREIDSHTCHLVIQWDQTRVNVPIKFNPVLFSNVDSSPMDKAHYPENAAYKNYLSAEEKSVTEKVEVTYSRPQKKGRKVFGELVPMGEVWRIGANEATEIVFFEDVMINNVNIKSGKYALFAEVEKDEWKMIFSKDYPIWGAHKRDITKDVATTTIAVTTEAEVVENLSIIFEDQKDGSVHMIIAWDQTRAHMPIQFKK
jgi:hypothetical protein